MLCFTTPLLHENVVLKQKRMDSYFHQLLIKRLRSFEINSNTNNTALVRLGAGTEKPSRKQTAATIPVVLSSSSCP